MPVQIQRLLFELCIDLVSIFLRFRLLKSACAELPVLCFGSRGTTSPRGSEEQGWSPKAWILVGALGERLNRSGILCSLLPPFAASRQSPGRPNRLAFNRSAVCAPRAAASLGGRDATSSLGPQRPVKSSHEDREHHKRYSNCSERGIYLTQVGPTDCGFRRPAGASATSKACAGGPYFTHSASTEREGHSA